MRLSIWAGMLAAIGAGVAQGGSVLETPFGTIETGGHGALVFTLNGGRFLGAEVLRLSAVFTTATGSVPVLYTGRDYPSGLSGFGLGELRLEVLDHRHTAVGDVVSLALSTGAFAADGTGVRLSSSEGWAALPRRLAMDSPVAALDVVALSAAGNRFGLSFDQPLNLARAATGDLTVVAAVGPATLPPLKLATIARASSSSANGTLALFACGTTHSTALADIVISESLPGALRPGVIGLALDVGRFDVSQLPQITVTQRDQSRNEVVLPPQAGHFVRNVGSSAADVYNVQLLESSKGTPWVIRISGLRLRVACPAQAALDDYMLLPSRDVTVKVFGNRDAVDADKRDTTDSVAYPSRYGAAVYSERIPVAKLALETAPRCFDYDFGPISSMSLVVGFSPAANDINRPGSMFVVAVVPAGQSYCMTHDADSRPRWHVFDGRAASCPGWYQGPIKNICKATLYQSLNLSGYSGTKLYMGYGIGNAATTDFDAMMRDGTYSLVHTVP